MSAKKYVDPLVLQRTIGSLRHSTDDISKRFAVLEERFQEIDNRLELLGWRIRNVKAYLEL